MQLEDQDMVHSQISALPHDSEQLYLNLPSESVVGIGYVFLDSSLYSFDYDQSGSIIPNSISKITTLAPLCNTCGAPYTPFIPRCYFTNFMVAECAGCCHWNTCMWLLITRRDILQVRSGPKQALGKMPFFEWLIRNGYAARYDGGCGCKLCREIQERYEAYLREIK